MVSDKFGHPPYETVLNTWTQEHVNDAHALLDMFEDLSRSEAQAMQAKQAEARARKR